MRTFAAFAVAAPLWAQTVSMGLRGGVPVTAALSANPPAQAATARATFGPLLEVAIGRGFAAGADFLLQRSSLSVPVAAAGPVVIWRWEAPLTAVYRPRSRAHPWAHPVLRAGVSLNRVFDVGRAESCGRGPFGERFYCLAGIPAAELRHRGTLGMVAGVGLRVRVGRARIEPELRWTHWRDRNFGVHDATVRSNLNEVEILAGLVF